MFDNSKSHSTLAAATTLLRATLFFFFSTQKMAAFRSPKVDGEVRWGIIGCGDVTEKKSGPALQQAARSKLVAVMRRDVEKAEDYAKRHHVPKF